MAGSYDHVTSTDHLMLPAEVLAMLDASGSPDVYGAIRELYGMVWYLAANDPRVIEDTGYVMHKFQVVEEARKNYKEGLVASPTTRFNDIRTIDSKQGVMD